MFMAAASYLQSPRADFFYVFLPVSTLAIIPHASFPMLSSRLFNTALETGHIITPVFV